MTTEKNSQFDSAFKIILTQYLRANGDMLKMPKAFRSSIVCLVKETTTFFMVTDGVFYTQCHFTPEALQEYKTRNHIPLHLLQGYLIEISRWSLELCRTDSKLEFCSYANLALKMIVHKFKLVSNRKN